MAMRLNDRLPARLSTSFAWGILLLVNCAMSGLAQVSLRQTVPDVAGMVVDGMGNPVQGAQVLVEDNPYSLDIDWLASMPERDFVLGSATTDALGRFRIAWRVKEVNALDNYNHSAVLVVSARGYAIAHRNFTLNWVQDFREIKLAAGVDCIGHVVDESGRPLGDAQVLLDGVYRDMGRIHFLSSSDGILSFIGRTSRPQTKTDADGRFRIPGLSSGEMVLLRINHPEFPSVRKFHPIDAASPGKMQSTENTGEFGNWYTEYGKQIRMRAGKSITVKAVDNASGSPLPGVEICSHLSGHSVTTDDNGVAKWLHSDLQDSTQKRESHLVVYVRKPGESRWYMEGVPNESAMNELRIRSTRIVSGHVRDKETSKGIEGVGVSIGARGRSDYEWTTTAADGRYSLSSFQPSARVEVHGPRSPYILPVWKYSSSTEEAHAKLDPAIHRREVSLLKNDVTDVDFSILRYAPIELLVLDQSGNPLLGEMANLCIGPYLGQTISAISDSQGVVRFDVDRVIYGTAYIWVSSKAGFGFKSFKGVPQNRLQLGLRPTIVIKAQVERADDEGNTFALPDKPIRVEFDLTSGRALGIDTDRPLYLRLATTDTNGMFSVHLPRSNIGTVELSVDNFNGPPQNAVKVDLKRSRFIKLNIDFP